MGNLQDIKELLKIITPAFIHVVGLVVMASWVFGFDFPIFLGTESAMQFNTALCLSMLSLAILTARYFRLLSQSLSAIVLLLSFLTIVQYAFGTPIGIDTMFVTEDVTTFPGRMSILTSISFSLLALVIMDIVPWDSKTVIPNMAIMSVPLSCSIIALIGYVLHIETAYSWYGMREMAPHTALSVLGLSLVAMAERRRSWLGQGGYKIYSSAAAIIGASVVLGLSIAEYRIEKQVEQNYLKASAIGIEKDLTLYLREVELSSSSLITMFDDTTTILESRMNSEVDAALNDLSPLIAVLMVADNQVLWQRVAQTRVSEELTGEALWLQIDQQGGLKDVGKWTIVQGEAGQSFYLIERQIVPFNDQEVSVLFITDFNKLMKIISEDIRYLDSFIKVQFGQDVLFDNVDETSEWGEETQQYFYSIGNNNVVYSLAANPNQIEGYLANIWYLFLLSGFCMVFLAAASIYYYMENKNIRFMASSWHNNLEKTFRNMNVAILAVNKKGAISLVNDNAINLFGYAEEELLGQKVEMLVPPSIAGVHPTYRDKFMRGNLSRPMENNDNLYGRKKNGEIVPLDIGLGKVENSEDVAVVLTIVDQTLRREAEEKIKGYTSELEKKNIDLANFSRILTHDLRDPIGRIITLTEMIEIYIKSQSHQKALEYIGVIEQSAEYAQNLITQLYDHISKGTDFKVSLCSVKNLISLAINTTNGLADNNKITISTDVDDDLKVDANEALIVQVLNNLIANSLKYNNKEKCILQITAHLRASDNMVVFGVADNGPGVKPEHADSIFNMFDRGSVDDETSATGMGLGLSTCKKIVEAHKGKIWVDLGDADEGGVTFYFTIPAHA